MDREARDFWRQQRRLALRERRRLPWRRGVEGYPATTALIALAVLDWLATSLVPTFLPGVAASPLGPVLLFLLSIFNPGSFLGLVFFGFFLWILGTQLEPMDEPWRYVALFVLPGAVAAIILGHALGGGMGFVPSFADFGLAGGYAYTLSRMGTLGRDQGLRWVIGLFILNAVLSGFQGPAVLGMAVAIASGFAVAAGFRYGGR